LNKNWSNSLKKKLSFHFCFNNKPSRLWYGYAFVLHCHLHHLLPINYHLCPHWKWYLFREILPDFYFQPFGCFSKTQTTIKFKSNSTQKFPQSLQEKRETTQYRLPNQNIEESQNLFFTHSVARSTEKQENCYKPSW
jgi:hypothetical protein